ncbi:hypothetical protein A2U01_0053476, partial [Trifolium medium]|nr:hypothetical protein [Trifolium medium]
MSPNQFSPSRTSRKVLRLVADLKEMLLEDLSYAVEDLEDAKPFFRVIDRLARLRSYLSPNQAEMLAEAQAVRRSLTEDGPFVNYVINRSNNLNHLASNINENSFKVKEDMK